MDRQPTSGRVVAWALCAALLPGCEDRGTEGGTSTAGTAPTPSGGAATTSAAASAAASGGSRTAPAGSAVAYESEELPEVDLEPGSLDEQRRAMLRRMVALGVADDRSVDRLGEIIFATKRIAQGNPEVVRHPMTRAQCLARRRAAGVRDEQKPLCHAPYMVPVYDPSREPEGAARICIDRYEFPGLPCEYPVTWVTTTQAQDLCHALGKRLCDAHEWEGACAGALLPAEQEYAFGQGRKWSRAQHNAKRAIRWAYGLEKDHSKCATSSHRSKGCTASGWKKCGSNTFPAGAFIECRSPLGVYDQHGNVAEHMALPNRPEELGSRGGFGAPEMKGSWFIFGHYEAHIDDCRWRCPAWHDNEGKNHSNYHLGFRCCKDVRPE